MKFQDGLICDHYSEKPNFIKKVSPIIKRMKVKFDCKCGNKWNSSKGGVMLILLKNKEEIYGFHLIELTNQCCKTCDSWNDPILYNDEVERVCNELMNPNEKSSTQRESDMKDDHDHERCGWCQKGICKISNKIPNTNEIIDDDFKLIKKIELKPKTLLKNQEKAIESNPKTLKTQEKIIEPKLKIPEIIIEYIESPRDKKIIPKNQNLMILSALIFFICLFFILLFNE